MKYKHKELQLPYKAALVILKNTNPQTLISRETGLCDVGN
jgi:hypothetical protein